MVVFNALAVLLVKIKGILDPSKLEPLASQPTLPWRSGYVRTEHQDVVDSNPSTGYWIDHFHIYLL